MANLLKLLLTIASLIFGMMGLLLVVWVSEDRLPLKATRPLTFTEESFTISKDMSDRVFVTVSKSEIDSSAFFGIKVMAEPLPKGIQGAIYWRRSGLDKLKITALPPIMNGNSLIRLEANQGWQGSISEIGFILVGRSHEPVRIHAVTLIPRTFMTEIQTYLEGVSSPETWSQRTINFLAPVPQGDQISLTIVAAIIFSFSTLFAALLLTNKKTRPVAGSILLASFVLIWIAYDARWQTVLLHNLAQAKQIYLGNTRESKQISAPDQLIFQYAEALKASVFPRTPQRIFIVQDSTNHDFVRLRLQYHLLPHNIYNIGAKLPIKHVRSGDYVIVLGKVPEIGFDHANSTLTIGTKTKRSATVVHQWPAAPSTVFKITSDASH